MRDRFATYPEFRPFFDVSEGVVEFLPGSQGAKYHKGVIKLGDRAGPECAASNLAHEMGHFLLATPEKATQTNWGLRVPYRELAGHTYVEPRTDQMTRFEARVVGYQARVLRYLGVSYSEGDLEDTADSLQYLPDNWFWTPGTRLALVRQCVEEVADAPIFDLWVQRVEQQRNWGAVVPVY